MNLQLAGAVIATFREAETESHFSRLSGFRYRSWVGIYSWLDASGLALYFLARVRALRIEAAIPVQVLQRLEENTADNKKNTTSIFNEFMEINRAFKDAGLSYANFKGFTLVPDSCADITLRCQLDLDFLMSAKDARRCESILAERGYSLTGTGQNVDEYKAGGERLPSARDLYKVKPQRSVEIHLVDGDGFGSSLWMSELSRLQSRVWNGSELPVFSDLDKFLGHARHLFKHLKGEFTRASWILEYANFISFHRENHTLWLEIKKYLTRDTRTKVAVGAATLIAEQTFGLASMPETLQWSTRELPAPVRLWVERYGNDVLMAKYPGTKLYLLLLWAISKDETETSKKNGVTVFPIHQPQRIVASNGRRNLILQLNQYWNQLSYFCFRLEFHLRQGFFYRLEEARWKRSIVSLTM